MDDASELAARRYNGTQSAFADTNGNDDDSIDGTGEDRNGLRPFRILASW